MSRTCLSGWRDSLALGRRHDFNLQVEKQAVSGSCFDPGRSECQFLELGTVNYATNRHDLAIAFDFEATNLSASRGANAIDDSSRHSDVLRKIAFGSNHRLVQ